MMIAKDIDPFSSQHDYEQAAQRALELIAAQLKQGFKDSPKSLSQMNPRIFHNVRFEFETTIAQLDHLIIHQYGIIVIENRGEPADLSVNTLGEWTQVFKGKELRISSPVTQGERKLSFLKNFLEAHAAVLRLNPQERSFDRIATALIVSISDEGEFTTSPNTSMPRVRRSADVFNHLNALMSEQRQACIGPFGRHKNKEQVLSEEELFRITSFLRSQHVPMEREVYQPNFSLPSDSEADYESTEAVSEADVPATSIKGRPSHYACLNCGCKQLNIIKEANDIKEAEHMYRMMCLDCGAKAEIECTCKHCGQEGFVSQNEDEYLIECNSCLRAEIIFVEPQASIG